MGSILWRKFGQQTKLRVTAIALMLSRSVKQLVMCWDGNSKDLIYSKRSLLTLSGKHLTTEWHISMINASLVSAESWWKRALYFPIGTDSTQAVGWTTQERPMECGFWLHIGASES